MTNQLEGKLELIFNALSVTIAKRIGKKMCNITHIIDTLSESELEYTREEVKEALNELIAMKLVWYFEKENLGRYYATTQIGATRWLKTIQHSII